MFSEDLSAALVTFDAARVTYHKPLGRVNASVIVVMVFTFTADVSTNPNCTFFCFYSP